jgi:hypothetical protein
MVLPHIACVALSFVMLVILWYIARIISSTIEIIRTMITQEQYIEFLISSPKNVTCTYLSDHIAGISHDSINDFLNNQRITSESLWTCVSHRLRNTSDAFLIVDDSVQEKPHARAMDIVYSHYSGNKHRVVRGIDIVNLVHSSGDGDYYPIDYRIYAPNLSHKTKNEYFREMLLTAFTDRAICADVILFDSWYASVENLKFIHRLNKIFYTTLKVNRLVSVAKDQAYIHLEAVTWTEDQYRCGQRVRLKEVPFDVRLFKLVATDGDIEWIVTNDITSDLTLSIVSGRNAVRWDIECLHRELKQLTGIERCQCQRTWAQRNHIALCYHAWLALKVFAKDVQKTLYRAKNDLFSDYLIRELKNPRIRSVYSM